MTERLNVLLFITELNVGGAEKIVAQLATRLSQDRYNVKVACLYDPEAVGSGIQASGTSVINLAMRNKGDLRAPHRLLQLLRDENIQILHAHLFHANLLAATIGKLARIPVTIVTRHSVEIGGKAREAVNRWARPMCDAVVTVSNEVYRAEVQRSKINRDQVVMIPGGVQVDAFMEPDQANREEMIETLGIRPTNPLIGTVGRFVPPKGYTHLLDALEVLCDACPTVQSLLVGDGPLRPAMEAKAKTLHLSKGVIFTGIRQDIPDILGLLDVFVLPSLWEGLPIALLEAMAGGLPVVATAVGGTPEVVVEGETGFLVPPRDPEALAEAILRLLRDPNLRRLMGEAGRKRVAEHFSVEQMVQKTEALYEHLLAEKGLA